MFDIPYKYAFFVHLIIAKKAFWEVFYKLLVHLYSNAGNEPKSIFIV